MPKHERQQRAVRGVDGVVPAAEPAERPRPVAARARGGHAGRGLAGADPEPEQQERRDADRGELEPVLHRLHEGDRAHAAGDHVGQDHDGDDEATDPGGRPGDGLQGQAGALELRQEVEPPDPEHQDRAEPADDRALQPGLGEVGQRVGAGPPQRGRHQNQEHEVADGVADREPQHVGAEGVDEAGDPQERGGREVLAADGGGVPAWRDGAAGDVEVAGGAGQAQPESADPQRHQADQGDRHHAVGRVHRRATRSAKSRSIRSECRT